MGSDPGHDPGLSASPWVAVELGPGGVTVDGVPVQGDGTAEGRYLAALQQVADEVAAPLGRRVGVTVSGAAGVVGHLAVHPDGTVDSIEELVQAAHAPAAVVVPAARAESPASPPPPAPPPAPPAGAPPARGGRRTLVVASAVLLAAAAVVAAPLVNGRDGELASSSNVDPAAAVGDEAGGGQGDDDVVEAAAGDLAAEAPADAPTGAAAQNVLAASVLRMRVPLAADVASTAPCEVTLMLPATSRVVRAEVRLRAADGRVVVRRLRLAPGRSGEVVVTDVAPGTARWSVRAPGAVAAAGRVAVMAPPPEPPPAPAAPSGSGTSSGGGSSSTAGGGAQPSSGGNGGGSSGGQPDPTVPIDPDDL